MARLISIAVCLSLFGCGVDPASEGDDQGPDFGGDQPGGGGGGGETPDDEQPTTDEELADPVFPTQHPRIYLGSQGQRLKAALASKTPAARKLQERVDAWVGGTTIWGFEAWNAALIGALTGDPKYCTKAVSTIEAQVVAAEATIASGNKPEVANNSYLHIGEMLGDLALVYDWCHTTVTEAQRDRWFKYANQAIHNVWNPDSSTWGGKSMPWTGWAVNNPANNYYYSFLRATMLVGLATKGEFPDGDKWINQFRTVKLANQLVPMFNADLVGGGSREGTGYGVAMRGLFTLYDFWQATTGEQIALLSPHTKTSMYAFMHQVMPTLDRIAPIGDHARDRAAPFYDYQRHYLAVLAHLNANDANAGRALTLLAGSNVPAMSAQFMVAYDFLYENADITAKPLAGLNTAYHAKGIGQVYARSSWDKDATWVGLIAGPYTEEHAHQDQGSLLLYKGGWLAHDAVVHTHSGIVQSADLHALVRIDNGSTVIKQSLGTKSAITALHKGNGYVHVAADITPAYKNNAAVQMVQRELVFVQPNVVVVYDRVRTSAGTNQTWQLPTPVSPAISGNAATITNAGHNLRVTRIAPSAAQMSVHSFAGTADFTTGGFRLDERLAGGDHRYLHVLSLDGAASSVTASGETGVTVNLAGGGQAKITFERDHAGAQLELDGNTVDLGDGVDPLPY
jgi:hypothetical protein